MFIQATDGRSLDGHDLLYKKQDLTDNKWKPAGSDGAFIENVTPVRIKKNGEMSKTRKRKASAPPGRDGR